MDQSRQSGGCKAVGRVRDQVQPCTRAPLRCRKGLLKLLEMRHVSDIKSDVVDVTRVLPVDRLEDQFINSSRLRKFQG